MIKWSRVHLVFSILIAEGFWRTWLERVQWAKPPALRSMSDGSQHLLPVMPRFSDYAGAAHIHSSTYSDGAGTIGEIAAAGVEAGVDFIIMADHNTIEARSAGDERWHCDSQVLMVIGSEVTVSDGHLLVFDVPESFYPCPHDAIQTMKALHEAGGYGFIALPCDLKGHWKNFNNREPGIGIEVFNLSSIARTKINIPSFLAALIRYRGSEPISAFSFITARPDLEMKVWDDMLGKASQNGEPLPNLIGSLDAHAVMRIAGREFFFPTYTEVFRTLRTHVLTAEPLSNSNENVEHDLKLLHDALRSGRAYASYDNYGDPKGFIVEIREGNAYIGSTGDTFELDLTKGILYTLAVRVPETRSIVRVYRNGKRLLSRRGGYLDLPITAAGVYRIEVMVYRRRIGNLCFGVRPWIFSNAVCIVQSEASSVPTRIREKDAAGGQDEIV
jgi:hypothetical protein